MNPLIHEIKELKKILGISILAHYYEEGDVQDVADFVGDSYFLAQKGQQIESQTILLAGVVFMAESVKILNPQKTVLVPDLNAGCSLVESSPYDKYLEWRMKYPDAIAMTYINSSAKVKSISDVICTSSNAEKIIQSIPREKKILFGPDKNLGRYLSQKYKRDMILWDGECFVHRMFSAEKLLKMAQDNPEAIILAHPECTSEVLKLADVIGSTSRLLEEVEKNPKKKFIVATESGIFHQMKKVRPDVELLLAPGQQECGCQDCFYMKLNTLPKIKKALVEKTPEVNLDPILIQRAHIPLQRMMQISAGKTVEWPQEFHLDSQI